METFLPVVRMDTSHAILALVAEKDFKCNRWTLRVHT
jgi:hypothetical protein